jgi:3-deoxy-D-manno-octulosonic-acid transferase
MSLERLLYRAVLDGVATGLRVATRLPGAPARWVAECDRLGVFDPSTRATLAGAPVLWIHAASVGELQAVRPLVTQLRRRFPGRACIVSTLTRTGLALARTLPDAHAAVLFPADAPSAVRAALTGVRLDAFFFTETEIWPTWLETIGASGAPAFMVSGRVSERTMRRAHWLRRLYRGALQDVVCCMQTEDDAARIVALGAAPARVHVAGSLKFDAAVAPPPPEVERLRQMLEATHARGIVAGSTHEGEDELVLDAYARVAYGHRGVVLLLAPRHPERMEAVATLVTERGFTLRRYSALATDAAEPALDAPCVILIDVVGPLVHCYALGEIAFVGGSLVPVGGHNVLEPARAGRPILVGPYTANVGDLIARMVRAEAAVQVETSDALAWMLDHLLAHPERAQRMGQHAAALALGGQGALDRHMRIIAAQLTRARFARDGA